MTAKEIYKIWAPAGKKWVDWVRPVPFFAINEYPNSYTVANLSLPVVGFVEQTSKQEVVVTTNVKATGQLSLEQTAIIVDLPGGESVRYGISLAKLGFRPIPVYNGTIEPPRARATVDNQSVGMALEYWAIELKDIHMDDNARPAFLLDRNRLNRYKLEESMFDNSWDVYPQDLPSAKYLMNSGIKSVLVVGGKKISKDLRKILGAYQKNSLEIYHTNGYEAPKRHHISDAKLGLRNRGN